ncbi:hypothetical protein ACHAWF_018624 [Thalassiosira exigua]
MPCHWERGRGEGAGCCDENRSRIAVAIHRAVRIRGRGAGSGSIGPRRLRHPLPLASRLRPPKPKPEPSAVGSAEGMARPSPLVPPFPLPVRQPCLRPRRDIHRPLPGRPVVGVSIVATGCGPPGLGDALERVCYQGAILAAGASLFARIVAGGTDLTSYVCEEVFGGTLAEATAAQVRAAEYLSLLAAAGAFAALAVQIASGERMYGLSGIDVDMCRAYRDML